MPHAGGGPQTDFFQIILRKLFGKSYDREWNRVWRGTGRGRHTQAGFVGGQACTESG